MPILDQWDLRLNEEAVLRGQGADPAVLRSRRPRLFDVAAQALEEGLPLVQPRVLFEHYPVEAILHARVRLAGGGELKGEALAQHLASAQEALLMVCTIGAELEAHANRVMEEDMVRGLALYGVGSAAVEALANAACLHFERQAAERGWQATIPLSPGMIGWSVEEGQPQIFSLLDGGLVGVRLSETAVMLPMKSLSLAMGLGPDLSSQGSTCDYCAMRAVCRYQTSDAQFA